MHLKAANRHHHVQAGFTLVEVLVAVVIVTIVGTGVVAALSQSANSQLRSKVQARQLNAAESVFARLKADTTWRTDVAACAASQRTSTACDVSALVRDEPALVDDRLELRFTAAATATAFDSPIDGLASKDEDGDNVDGWRLSVTVSGTGRDAALKPVVLTGTLTMGAEADVGTLVVQACSVGPQVDERVRIGSCDTERRRTLPEPHTEPTNEAADWQAWWSAPEWARGITVSPMSGVAVHVVPRRGPKVRQSARTDASGKAVFEGLAPGTYEVEVEAPATLEPWINQTQPSESQVEVVAGSDADMLAVFRPATRTDVTVEAWLGGGKERWQVNPAQRADPLVLVPAPLGRAPVVPARNGQQYTRVRGGGSTSLRFDDVPPGLYIAYVASSEEDLLLPFVNRQRYLWVDPGGSIVPAQPTADDFTTGTCLIAPAYLQPGAVATNDAGLLGMGAEIDPCDRSGLMWGMAGS